MDIWFAIAFAIYLILSVLAALARKGSKGQSPARPAGPPAGPAIPGGGPWRPLGAPFGEILGDPFPVGMPYPGETAAESPDGESPELKPVEAAGAVPPEGEPLALEGGSPGDKAQEGRSQEGLSLEWEDIEAIGALEAPEEADLEESEAGMEDWEAIPGEEYVMPGSGRREPGVEDAAFLASPDSVLRGIIFSEIIARPEHRFIRSRRLWRR
ncbi:MAG TPA: hypothetical protein GXX51_00655 [Firmicutes bacterium]|nr:hypothetical protein [Bacillota bacterium]